MECIECGADVEAREKDGREVYICENHHERERMFQNEGLSTLEKDGEVIHESVGAVPVREGKVLLLKRRKYPYSHSIPAGHLEEGEKPQEAVARELEEETGLDISAGRFEKIFEGVIEDRCRRGADRHRWNLYTVRVEDDTGLEKNDEAEKLRWVPLEDVDGLELTAPTEKFLVDEEAGEIA